MNSLHWINQVERVLLMKYEILKILLWNVLEMNWAQMNLRDAIIKDVKDELKTDEITEYLQNCEKSISSLKTDIEYEYLESEVKG